MCIINLFNIMFLVNVVPISYLPYSQNKTLLYFSSQKYNSFSLAWVSLGKRKIEALIISCRPITSKISIKKSSYQIKPIGKIINPNPIINQKQWELFKWISFYYFIPISSLLKYILPSSKILQLINIKNVSTQNFNNKKNKPLVLFGDDFKIIKEQIKKILKNNQQILFIFPNQIKLEFYFNNLIEWQKEIFILKNKNNKKTIKNFESINNNEIKIIFGKRSSLFIPFSSLGLIILVDESNIGHKTIETKIHYDAKKVSFALQKIWQSQLIITTPTPSIETFLNLENKKYQSLNKFNDLLINNSKFIIESNSLKQENFLNTKILESIKKTIDNKKTVIIFNNRRGHSPALICNNCGYIFRCPYCDAALVYHKNNEKFLICHHCGYKIIAPDICPNCQSHLIKFIGLGNQRMTEYLKNYFSNINIDIFDSDYLKNIKQEKEMFQKFLNREFDVLIVTELFLKYLDLIEKINITIIPSIEQLLVSPDFATEEKIREILTLFSNKSQNIFVQTINPEKKWLNELFKKDFYFKQIKIRQKTLYPPFGQMIKIKIKSKKLDQLNKLADYVHQILDKNISILFKKDEYVLSSPIFPTVSKVKNFYFKEIYWRLKIDDDQEKDIILKRNAILKLLPDEVEIKIDPTNLF